MCFLVRDDIKTAPATFRNSEPGLSPQHGSTRPGLRDIALLPARSEE
jgi:hypothetical protein